MGRGTSGKLVGREPFGVGPGERNEPFELFGWLPLGETWGLEPLRPKRRILVATTGREYVDGRCDPGEVCWERRHVQEVKKVEVARKTAIAPVAEALVAGESEHSLAGAEPLPGDPWTKKPEAMRRRSLVCKEIHTCAPGEYKQKMFVWGCRGSRCCERSFR